MPPPPEHRPVDRRRFFAATAAGAALSLNAASYAAVPGSNDRVRVGFLGCGARAQAHVHLIARHPLAAPVAVCDVWDGLDEEYEHRFGNTVTRRKYSQGLYPTAVKCGLDPADRGRVTKDYRRVLDRKDVDVVCIGTPDHWHARMTLDALAAGKDVFVETPLARTTEEAAAVAAAAERAGRVVTVGCQSMADPGWRVARDAIVAGTIGPVSHLSAGVFRADPRGYWRFYRVVPQMTPATIDWDLFLGHRFAVDGVPVGPPPRERPFDPVAFAQWRCVAAFGGGPFADLYAHPVTRLLAAAGLGFPDRVVGAGGLYFEHDGRDVPDVATVAAEFPGRCHLTVTGSTAAAHPQDDTIRGRAGALTFVRGGVRVHANGTAEPVTAEAPRNETDALWADFLDRVRSRDRATLCPPDLGAAAVAVGDLARRSLAAGRAFTWDAATRSVRGA